MAKNEARRQKQLAKKKAKREEKRSQIARQTSHDPTIRLASAAAWPIVETLIPVDLWEQGIGNLILARRHPTGQIAAAVFLVDVWCLGSKNAYWNILPESEYRAQVRKLEKRGELQNAAPEYFAKLVHDAVEYAQSFGFPPHPDYRHARMLLQGIDASLCSEKFEFGKDGKPLYVAGPYDSEEKIKTIMHRLGEGRGEFIVPISPSEEIRALTEEQRKMIETEETEPE
jgi:hypothetical protein